MDTRDQDLDLNAELRWMRNNIRIIQVVVGIILGFQSAQMLLPILNHLFQ